MPISLRDVILREEAPGGPLFPTGGSLADAVASISGSSYAKRRDSLYGLLMQIFRSKRNCPPELTELIVQAVKQRLQGQPSHVINNWVERVRQAIDYQSLKPEGLRPFVAEELFEEMLSTAERATVHFIINSRTIEERGAQGKARTLQSILIRRLNLYKCDLVDSDPPTRYIFCLPTSKIAELFWRGLLRSVTTNALADQPPLDIGKAKERLKFLEQTFLRVLEVPEHMCGCPIVVFDPDDGPSAYSFCFHPGDRASIMKWDPDSISKWNSLVYTPLKVGGIIEPDPIPRPFSSYNL